MGAVSRASVNLKFNIFFGLAAPMNESSLDWPATEYSQSAPQGSAGSQVVNRKQVGTVPRASVNRKLNVYVLYTDKKENEILLIYIRKFRWDQLQRGGLHNV